MLAQSLPPDLEKRIEQVASVVHGRTGDEISVALHDNDYDPDRAVAALLDEDGGNVTVSGCGVWGRSSQQHTVQIGIVCTVLYLFVWKATGNKFVPIVCCAVQNEWTTTQRKGKRRPAEGSSEQQPAVAPHPLADHRPPRRGPRPGRGRGRAWQFRGCVCCLSVTVRKSLCHSL